MILLVVVVTVGVVSFAMRRYLIKVFQSPAMVSAKNDDEAADFVHKKEDDLQWHSGITGRLRVCKSCKLPISLAYEIVGDPSTQPLLVLICGLNANFHMYTDEFCAHFVRAGFAVLRFDNRDTGHSTHLDALGKPNIFANMFPRIYKPKRVYKLDDMAEDVVALVDYIQQNKDQSSKNTENKLKFHVAGCSMGGMIVQCMLINSEIRSRLLSATSIMSTTSALDLPDPDWSTKLLFLKKPKSARLPDLIDFQAGVTFGLGAPLGSRNNFNNTYVRYMVTKMYSHSVYKMGLFRQMRAIVGAENREPALKALKEDQLPPTMVIHGQKDRLTLIDAGYRTAKCIAGSTLKIYEEMGHHLDYHSNKRIAADMIAHMK